MIEPKWAYPWLLVYQEKWQKNVLITNGQKLLSVCLSKWTDMFQPFYFAANQVFSYNKTDSAKALLDALSREPEAELCRTLTIHKTKDTHQFRKCGEWCECETVWSMGEHVSERGMKCEWDVWGCSIEAVSHVIYIPKYETSHHHHPEMVHKGTQRKDKLWSMWRRMNREGQSNRKGGKKGNQSWEPGPHNIAEQAAQWKIQVWNVTIWHGLQLKLNQTELSFLKSSLAQR